MAKQNQGSNASETRISVDMNAADPNKAVTRSSGDIASGVRDDADTDRPRTKVEKELFKRMGRMERNLTKQFDQRQAERDAEHQRQISELQAKLDRVQVEGRDDDAADKAHEAAITALKEKLEAAYEKGDSKASAEITLQISQLDAKFWAAKAAKAGVTTREAAGADKGKGAQPTQQPTQNRAGKGPTAAGSRFITANEEWWDDPAFEVEQSAANTIYLRLVEKEGFDPKSDETFKEIAKQVKARFPKLDIRAGRDEGPGDDDGDGDDDGEASEGQRNQGQGRQRRAAAANVQDRGPTNNRNQGGTRTLTPEEIQTMQACRLDPNNDRDVVQFLREAAAMEAAQA
jgi:hypothetical protein